MVNVIKQRFPEVSRFTYFTFKMNGIKHTHKNQIFEAMTQIPHFYNK